MQPSADNTEAQEGQSTTKVEVAMTAYQKRFYASEECAIARNALQKMVDNSAYNTESDYFSESVLGFVDRHLYYLSTHATTNIEGYLSNLKLMTSMKAR